MIVRIADLEGEWRTDILSPVILNMKKAFSEKSAEETAHKAERWAMMRITQSIFELWANSCADNGTELWELESRGKETGLYLTKSKHLVNHNYFYDTPIYHVWENGKILISTTNIDSAYTVWNRIEKKER